MLVRLAREARIRGLLIRSGKPDVFIAGADVKEFATGSRPRTSARRSSACRPSSSSSRTCRIPTVAAINGVCLGRRARSSRSRATTALMSDSKKAQIGLPEVRLGHLPGLGRLHAPAAGRRPRRRRST